MIRKNHQFSLISFNHYRYGLRVLTSYGPFSMFPHMFMAPPVHALNQPAKVPPCLSHFLFKSYSFPIPIHVLFILAPFIAKVVQKSN